MTNLLDVSSGCIDCTELELGDSIMVRNDFVVTQGTNNNLLELRYALGTGGGSYTLEHILSRLDSGSVPTYRFSLDASLIYMGDLNTRDNPIFIQLKLGGAGSVVNNGTVIWVNKRA